jgi:Holliday junction resolvase RusA-like endonuclease
VKYTFTIVGRLPGINEIIGKARSNHYASAAQKRRWTAYCAKAATEAGLPKITKPVKISVAWFEPNTRRDADNVAGGGTKFVLDGLVDAGVLPDDSQAYVTEFHHVVAPDKLYPRVVVTLEEVE